MSSSMVTMSYLGKLFVLIATIVLVTVITLMLLIKPYLPTIIMQPGAGAGQSPSARSDMTNLNQSAIHFDNATLDLQKKRAGLTSQDDSSGQVVNLSYYRSHVDAELRRKISIESTMPFKKFTLPAAEILRQNWTNQIQDFLRSCSRSSPVTVVAANYLYRDVVINWLIAARVKVEPPLENILVVSFDSPLQELMQHVGIQSVGVFFDSLFSNGQYSYKKLLMARVIIVRLINYWGYDVAHYDTDAIVLKNPLPLFNKHADSDVVGSTGTFPFDLGKKWGFTLCMGMIFFRCTPQTELFWEAWSKCWREAWSKNSGASSDDQRRLNYALSDMNIIWDSRSSVTVESHAKGERGFKVTALSHLQVCRKGQCHAGDVGHYYIWHKGGAKSRDSKIKTSSEIGSWHVKKDWESITRETTAKGVEWLRKICK